MAFKMKGSPIKLGKIQGTAGHASALKQTKEQKEHKFDKLAEEEGTRKPKKSKFDKLTEEEGKAKSAVEMKSPVKHSGREYAKENVEIHKGKRYEVDWKTQMAHDKAHNDGVVDKDHNPIEKKKKEPKEVKKEAGKALGKKSPNEMKSPFEQETTDEAVATTEEPVVEEEKVNPHDEGSVEGRIWKAINDGDASRVEKLESESIAKGRYDGMSPKALENARKVVNALRGHMESQGDYSWKEGYNF